MRHSVKRLHKSGAKNCSIQGQGHVYAPGLQIPTTAVLRIARDMAAAVAHLHQRGVMHGDLYAHNILWNPADGQALLSDFGGATLLPLDQPDLSRSMLALEVRAFGCLLDELVAHAEPDAGQVASMADVYALAQACLSAKPLVRPSMADVANALARC